MNTILKIAWRNIWRNKRRTFITIASIMFALFFSTIMRGFQLGSYANMKRNAVEAYSGYVQIHKKGYWDDKNINNIFSIDEKLVSKLENDSRVKVIIPRIESFALASSGESSKGVLVMGVSPDKEDKMTQIKSYLEEGEFISENDKSILVAQDLAKFLKVGVNDSLVLFSSGYHGATAAGLYAIKGIVKLPTPEMNRGTIYLPIEEAKSFLSTEGKMSALVFDLHDLEDADGVLETVSANIDHEKYEVLGWKLMNKELIQMIESDNAGGIVMISILYLVIAFGIFGTVLMMTNERTREFSVMVSLGMQKTKLAMVVLLELFFMTLLGVVAGIAISLPIMIYYYYNPIVFTGESVEAMKEFNFEPIMPMSLDPQIFLTQAIAISIISLIAMSYPTIKIMTMNVINGLRS
ncbi:MAG: ABC transporter permease [Flavobacteriales bacterium]|nr:ABC transporter permease [Flavobacteriales bacterium]